MRTCEIAIPLHAVSAVREMRNQGNAETCSLFPLLLEDGIDKRNLALPQQNPEGRLPLWSRNSRLQIRVKPNMACITSLAQYILGPNYVLCYSISHTVDLALESESVLYREGVRKAVDF
jgi:hypothetical protein